MIFCYYCAEEIKHGNDVYETPESDGEPVCVDCYKDILAGEDL
jgi:hypothetical protein